MLIYLKSNVDPKWNKAGSFFFFFILQHVLLAHNKLCWLVANEFKYQHPSTTQLPYKDSWAATVLIKECAHLARLLALFSEVGGVTDDHVTLGSLLP